MAGETYFSLNNAETQLLRGATFEAIGLYLILKEKASFETGEVGTYFRQSLTYAWFARQMGRPASQGRAAREFDTTDVQRLLAQLTALGLVEDEQWDGQRLTLRIPYSPLWKGNPQLKAGKVKLPRGMQANASESNAAQASSPVASSLSVVSSERGSTPFFTTAITTDSGGGSAADPLKREAAPQATAAVQRHATPNLAEQFRAVVAKEGGLMADTPISRDFYAAWAKTGVTVEQLQLAIFDLTFCNPAPFKPGDINNVLFPKRHGVPLADIERQRQQRARVAL